MTPVRLPCAGWRSCRRVAPSTLPGAPRRDELVQLVQRRGLPEVRLEAGLTGALPILRLRVPAQRDEARRAERRVLPQLARDLVPVHVGQADVADDDLGLQLARPRDPREAVGRDPL